MRRLRIFWKQLWRVEHHIVSSAPRITPSWLHGAGKLKQGRVFLSGQNGKAFCLAPPKSATDIAILPLSIGRYETASSRSGGQPCPFAGRDDPPVERKIASATALTHEHQPSVENAVACDGAPLLATRPIRPGGKWSITVRQASWRQTRRLRPATAKGRI